ncbi:MAG: hypothetical protein GEV13_13865 [Rhodospirillales bacterium]|nr:hypothetical protein [Rhodospirillales bacterium]
MNTPANIFPAPGNTTYAGREQITSLSTVKSLTPPSNARWAILVPERPAVRISLAGGTRTTADMLIDVGQPVEVTTALANVRLLEAVLTPKQRERLQAKKLKE